MSTNDKVVFNNGIYTFESLGIDLNNSTIDTLLPLIPERTSFMGWVGDSSFRNELNNRVGTSSLFWGHISISRFSDTWNCNYINYDSNLTYSAKFTHINSKGWSRWEVTTGVDATTITGTTDMGSWSGTCPLFKMASLRIMTLACVFPNPLPANTTIMTFTVPDRPIRTTWNPCIMNKSPYYNACGISTNGTVQFSVDIPANTTVRGTVIWSTE